MYSIDHMNTLVPRAICVMHCYSNSCLLNNFTLRTLTISMTMADEARIERCERENEMMENVKEFLKDGCKCSRGPKDGPCSSQFTEEVIIANLNNCHKLSSRELDLVILANIQAVTRVKNAGQKRNRSPRCNFLFQSKPICRHMFLVMYGISFAGYMNVMKTAAFHQGHMETLRGLLRMLFLTRWC